MSRYVKCRSLAGITVLSAVLSSLYLVASASAQCASFHGDPGPGYTGPLMRGISCSYDNTGGNPESWIVPAGTEEAKFSVNGADDPGGVRGGKVEATLAVLPSETLTLVVGGPGSASSVSRGDTRLLTAAGGNGLDPNYIAPGASETTVIPAGGLLPPYPLNGSIYVSWWTGDVIEPGEDSDHNDGGHNGGGPNDGPKVKCVVPKLRDRHLPAARRALLAAHCTVGEVVRRAVGPRLRGRVIGQSPHRGSSLPENSAVDLTVGRR